MSRLTTTLQLDVRNQYRRGFYLAAAIVLTILASLMQFVPSGVGVLLPAILLTNMTISTFAFVAGLMLLEKSEGVLEALAVSPLRDAEYITSKIGTLGFLALAENVTIAVVASQTGLVSDLGWGWIVIASIMAATLYTLLGLLCVIRFDSINDFLFPMMIAVTFLELPGGVCFGMPEFPWLIVFPTYGLLWLFRAAQESVDGWALVYGIVYPTIWIAGCGWLCGRELRRYVRSKAG